MSRLELQRRAAQPTRLTVFRGCGAGGERGWSWTLDRSVAEDFARRYREDASDEALLVTADVDRAVVIAYLRSGGEDELILDPDALDWGTITITRVPPSTSADRVSSG